ncbi:NAD-dependent succinate-semialdehyde dehydrogenase [Colwellia demingiae]|uniref:NAD-dependent succinate-semialdehyde dehydrogenase n=1 Tax=Colwellia demingiae TaxID=89401 RepID=A0A5C6Q659_9GAMM|nr:NAD-dependent succinate-semialdehyde dehydrogenase [Colwellia demingiae]TWX64353.1 NAD-dependent succinate-semialdehyde dehydrogenase [Colwellia demingiae]
MYELKGLYIDGEWSASSDGKTINVVDPAEEKVIGQCAAATKEDTERAILSAQKGLDTWSKFDPWQRGEFIRRAADLMAERIDQNARATVLETGKPLAQAKREWELAIDQFIWFSEETKRIYGRTVESRLKNGHIRVDHSPVGVVAAFTAWNFPVALVARKLAPALAAGCSVICRPSTETPASATAMVECCHDAGIPAGVVNLLTGSASVTSPVIMQSPIVRKISLTGSTPLGKKLVRESAETMKKVTMELGGHGPCVIFDDANLSAALDASVASKFGNCGQVCVSPNRFYVQSGVFEEFSHEFARKASELVVGNGRDENVQMGPLRTAKRLAEVDELVRDAIECGAKVLVGGRPMNRDKGHYYEPTVLVDVPRNARLMHEESFGPIAVINRFDDFDDVINQANDTNFGLAAYVWSQSLHLATEASKQIKSGMVGVNTYALATAEAPFGGIKESGIGREGGSECLADYMNLKYTHVVTQV